MNRIKKVLISFGVFFTGLTSKIFASSPLGLSEQMQTKYGVYGGSEVPRILGIEIPVLWKIWRVVFLVIVFVIGLATVLSKNITKRIKIISVTILVILGIINWLIINYIATYL